LTQGGANWKGYHLRLLSYSCFPSTIIGEV
jgi:hypothetical protein